MNVPIIWPVEIKHDGIVIPEGWRKLVNGEEIKGGDFYNSEFGQWTSTMRESSNDKFYSNEKIGPIYIRKLVIRHSLRTE